MRSPERIFAAALALAPLAVGAQDAALARQVLRELVEIRTVHPDGDSTAAAQAAARHLLEAGFDPADVRIVEPAPRKGNLVARLRGTGEMKPMLLLAHIDVVDARAEDWSGGLDPWKVTERDGWLYGRGTMDDKGAASIFVATLARARREGWRPKRDVILALTTDEEGGTHNGVKWLLENERALIDAEFAINEGGSGTLRHGKPSTFNVQVSEKMYLTFDLEATSAGGHSALPVAENSIYDIARALEGISRLQFPARIGPVVRALAGRLASQQEPGPLAEALAAVGAGNPTVEQLRVMSANPSHNAQLRTTCVATRMEGGHADNALPQRARATVNCRLLPGEDGAFVRGELQKAAGSRVTVTPKGELRPSPETDPGSSVMQVIRREALAMWAGVAVLPVMSAGATDGSRLRNAGIPVYGVLPIFMESADWRRMHGPDERIPAKGFGEALGYFGRLVRALGEGR